MSRRPKEHGFTLPEILIVIIIIMIILAFAIPNLFSSRKAANEGLVKPRLASAAAAQATYKSTLGRNTYATLAQLRSTVVGNVPLISPTEVDASGQPISDGGWIIGELEQPTANTFGLGMRPAGASTERLYCVFEDGVIRVVQCGSGQCNCTRSSSPVAKN